MLKWKTYLILRIKNVIIKTSKKSYYLLKAKTRKIS